MRQSRLRLAIAAISSFSLLMASQQSAAAEKQGGGAPSKQDKQQNPPNNQNVDVGVPEPLPTPNLKDVRLTDDKSPEAPVGIAPDPIEAKGEDIGGTGGPLARFGPGSRPADPSPVFAHPGNARNIVFVIDGSGSMTNSFAALKAEMIRTITSLKPIQKFDLVFFQDGKYTSLCRDKAKAEGLLPAVVENKRKASEFLEEVTISSTSDPIPALNAVFARKPDLVYLLTNGDFPDNAAVLKLIRESNKPVDGKTPVRFNTIAFVDDKDTEVEFKKLLETISKECSGDFRVVNADKLKQ